MLRKVAEILVEQLRTGHKILFFGNGGSAADAQHLAAEFVNRLVLNRPALPALAITTDTSILTSIANDFDFKSIFSRQIEALGVSGDIAWGISTSGNSPNVIEGFRTAHSKGMTTIASLGNLGGVIKDMVDYPMIAPSNSTQRIQEVHILLGHALCEWVERTLFK
ncbi:D-sedoheptulose 7-phosphate isomerase [bacterium]|nr:D-sedoheptulose 7-phosphate isomerase [candidate division CSSED10-310 bacterium]